MHETTLWDGRRVWCYGFREGLPVFKYLTAPIGLVTRTQLGEQQLRRHRGQDPVALLVFHKAGCGEQVAPLYVLEHAVPARTKTSALLDRLRANAGGWSGPMVIYGEASRLGSARLKDEGVNFKQTPYDVRAR